MKGGGEQGLLREKHGGKTHTVVYLFNEGALAKLFGSGCEMLSVPAAQVGVEMLCRHRLPAGLADPQPVSTVVQEEMARHRADQ